MQILGNLGAKQNLYFMFLAPQFKKRSRATIDLDSIALSSQTKRLKKLVYTAFLLDVRIKTGKFACCVLGQGTQRDCLYLCVLDR